jgi:thiamine-monophosphate kinase
MAEEEKKKYTQISELGEFGLIHQLTDKIELHHKSTIKGVGDDAAVISPPLEKGEVLLFSTDMMAEGIHFELTYTPLRHLGYKAVAANVSDICAMNGQATHIVVAIAVSNQYSVESLEEIYKGIRYACKEYNVDLVGGDTTSSRSGLVVNVSVIGKAQQDKIVYRNKAMDGDLVCVSGDLGAAYAGLFLLEAARQTVGKDPSLKPEFAGFGYVLQRQLMPHARVDIIEMFAASGVVPHAMIDISDGLSSEINHICEDSGVGCLLDEDKLPMHEETLKIAQEAKVNPTIVALNGGEDYELLFTISAAEYKKLKDPAKVTIIGEILSKEEGIKLAGRDGKLHDIPARGWDGLKEEQK